MAEVDMQQIVKKIENGFVIDHIPPGKSEKIIKLLGMEDKGTEMYVGRNVPSKKLGRKDFIKIVGLKLTKNSLDKVSLIANATVSRIENFSVAEKIYIDIPQRIENILKCPNLNCISNNEPFVKTIFLSINKNPLVIKCVFCEMEFFQQELEFL